MPSDDDRVSDVRAALAAHVRAAFPERSFDEIPGTPHVREAIADFTILRSAPRARGEPWVYVSLGAWEATRDEADGIEFAILSPIESAVHVDSLSTAAYFHSFYGLPLGRALKVGRGWLPESELDRLLVSEPRPLPRAIDRCAIGERRVSFVWLRPITRDEESFAKKNGVAALEAKLGRVDHLAKTRASVA